MVYQLTHVPFGVTNGVACFQREMTNFVFKEYLSRVFHATICGKDQIVHDANLSIFPRLPNERI